MLSIIQYISENEDLMPIDPNQTNVNDENSSSNSPGRNHVVDLDNHNWSMLSGMPMNDNGDIVVQKDYIKDMSWDGPNPKPTSFGEFIQHPVRGLSFLFRNTANADLVQDRDGKLWISSEDGQRIPYEENGDWAKHNPQFARSVAGPREMPAVNPYTVGTMVAGGVGGAVATQPLKAGAARVVGHELGSLGSAATRFGATQAIEQPLFAAIR